MIEISEGFELVGFRIPEDGDLVLNRWGGIVTWSKDNETSLPLAIFKDARKYIWFAHDVCGVWYAYSQRPVDPQYPGGVRVSALNRLIKKPYIMPELSRDWERSLFKEVMR